MRRSTWLRKQKYTAARLCLLDDQANLSIKQKLLESPGTEHPRLWMETHSEAIFRYIQFNMFNLQESCKQPSSTHFSVSHFPVAAAVTAWQPAAIWISWMRHHYNQQKHFRLLLPCEFIKSSNTGNIHSSSNKSLMLTTKAFLQDIYGNLISAPSSLSNSNSYSIHSGYLYHSISIYSIDLFFIIYIYVFLFVFLHLLFFLYQFLSSQQLFHLLFLPSGRGIGISEVQAKGPARSNSCPKLLLKQGSIGKSLVSTRLLTMVNSVD